MKLNNQDIVATQAHILNLEAEIERLRTERDLLLRSFTDACDEAECDHDNEALLMAIRALKEK